MHTGARGKAGGIKVCHDEYEVWDAADGLLDKCLVTKQTGPRGQRCLPAVRRIRYRDLGP